MCRVHILSSLTIGHYCGCVLHLNSVINHRILLQTEMYYFFANHDYSTVVYIKHIFFLVFPDYFKIAELLNRYIGSKFQLLTHNLQTSANWLQEICLGLEDLSIISTRKLPSHSSSTLPNLKLKYSRKISFEKC